jgi:hypothetical protein
MALFDVDKRRVDEAEQEKIKKTLLKGLNPAAFDALAAYYTNLK